MSPTELFGLRSQNMYYKPNYKRDSNKWLSPFGSPVVFLYLTLSLASMSAVRASAARETWPWIAFIPSLKCTGAIVHNRWLLTASQCFQNKSEIPSELFIEIREVNIEGKVTGVRRIFVIDYTRDAQMDSIHGLTMLYLARTIPSLTRVVVPLRAENSPRLGKYGIVLSWDSVVSKTGLDATSEISPAGVNIIALSVDISTCVDQSHHLCASLDKHLSSASGSALYCPRVSLGSPLVLLDSKGRVSLAGVLHQRSDCQARTKVLGRFTRVDHATKLWIRRQFRIQDFPQCQPNVYRTLDDPLRDLRKERVGPSLLCDKNISRAWYRFTLGGQPAELPTTCPEANKCGSSSLIWLPQADVIEIGKQVQINACATWTVDQSQICCFWKLSVFVRHCGDFKVYRLRRTGACPTSYCANVTKGHCGVGKTGYKPNCKDSYPKLPNVLQLYPFYAYQGRPTRPYLYLRCLLYGIIPKNENIKYFFSIVKLERQEYGALVRRTVRLLETSRRYCDTLLIPERHNVALGDTVVCEVSSFFRSTKDIKSPLLSSKIYHLGIKVHSSSTTVLTRSQNLDVAFTITLPVVCPKKNSNCSLSIPLTTSLMDVGSWKQVNLDSYFTLSKCSLLFTPKRCSRNTIGCGIDTIRLQAGKNLRNSDIRLRIKLGPVSSSDALWKDTNFTVVDVFLKPTLRFTCYSMSTSNIKTFDGSYFKHLGEGTFIFYRSVSAALEVQIRKWRCNDISTCPCAVAVREGNDVIVADMCNGQYKQTSLRIIVRSKLPLHQRARVIESNGGKSFTFQLSSGSQITVDEFEWGINIHLTTIELDNSRGLCRGLNFHSTTPDKLSRKIKDSDSLFSSSILPVNSPPITHKKFCACSGLKTLNLSKLDCPPSTSRLALEDGSHDITQKIIDKQRTLQKGVSPRSSSDESHDQSLQADGPRLSLPYGRRLEICASILNGTYALLACKNVLGENIWKNMWQICLQDIQEGLDHTLLKSNRKAITRHCEQKLDEYDDNHSLLAEWKSVLCEDRCGGNGHCYYGNCKCNEGYGSTDCSVPLNTPPKLFPLEDPLCDGRYEMCEERFITGTPFLNSKSISCSFTPVQRSGNTWKEDKERMFTAKALFYSQRGVICTIPRNRRSDIAKSQEALYIRVSNDGYEWSKPILRISYDSLCQNCSSSGYCIIKPGTCDIESRCFIHGDIPPKNRCLRCSSTKNPRKWSQREDNLPPIFISPVKDTISVFVNDFVTFLVKATDPENQPMKITHDVPQAQLNTNGEFRWKPGKESTRTIQLLATDECGRSAAKYVDVIIRRCLCRNGGKCPKTTNSTYQCLCPDSFKGLHCELKILPCSSNPCLYGTCANNGDNFRCICDRGYHGNTCDVKIPACSSNPCKRGSCVDLTSGFRCECPKFYKGRLCETEAGPCARNPCVRGTCKESGENSFKCICPEGFYGKLCSDKRTPCSPNPCHGGRCVVVLGTSMQCICSPRHHGKFCNLTGVYCGNKPCVNGVCESTLRGQRCACRKGFTGEQCDVACTIDCVYGRCVATPRGTTCVCHEGYTGLNCNIKRNPCETNPCAHGWCIDTDDDFVCRCHAGYSGALCNVSACASSDCGNGTCIIENGIPVCRCFKGFFGNHCDRRKQPCDSKPCANGLCITTDNSFKCSCNPGYHGLLCDQKTNPCEPNPCENGLCTANGDGKLSCDCSTGYTGPLCKKKRDACFSNPCVHGACVVESRGEFRCECNSGHVGVLCEKRFNICASSPCVNGRCSSAYEGTFFCTCDQGFSGTLCEIDGRPCSKSPCFQGVSCANVENTFKCGDCPSGFVGDGVQCKPEKADKLISPCPRQFCYPGVKCSIVDSEIHCGECPRGYYGNGFNCQVLCKIACMNGGTCLEPGVCQCPQGFLGATCSRVVCKRRCLNGGRCISPDKCYCPFGFYGERCEKARCHVRCLNGGRCIPPDRCRCPRGYAGHSCEQAVCTLPCLNGGLCVKPGTCRCPPGYFGTRCEEGTCFPQCRNRGVCVRNNMCSCRQGYRGDRCQTAVCRRQCQNGGRCFEKDQCSCPYGYWGETCQYVHCLRPCLNGGVCIKPSVCLCLKSYAGVSCQLYVG